MWKRKNQLLGEYLDGMKEATRVAKRSCPKPEHLEMAKF